MDSENLSFVINAISKCTNFIQKEVMDKLIDDFIDNEFRKKSVSVQKAFLSLYHPSKENLIKLIKIWKIKNIHKDVQERLAKTFISQYSKYEEAWEVINTIPYSEYDQIVLTIFDLQSTFEESTLEKLAKLQIEAFNTKNVEILTKIWCMVSTKYGNHKPVAKMCHEILLDMKEKSLALSNHSVIISKYFECINYDNDLVNGMIEIFKKYLFDEEYKKIDEKYNLSELYDRPVKRNIDAILTKFTQLKQNSLLEKALGFEFFKENTDLLVQDSFMDFFFVLYQSDYLGFVEEFLGIISKFSNTYLYFTLLNKFKSKITQKVQDFKKEQFLKFYDSKNPEIIYITHAFFNNFRYHLGDEKNKLIKQFYRAHNEPLISSIEN
jgi:hypothetical protein